MFRNLMLWWLTTGVYCVENENGQHVSGHTTPGHNDELAFAFAVFYFALTFVSGAGWKEWSKRSKGYFTSTGSEHMWLKWDMSSLGCWKGNHVCCVLWHFYLWLQHINCLSPSGLSLVRCCTAVFRDNCFLAVFTICECFVAGTVWSLRS